MYFFITGLYANEEKQNVNRFYGILTIQNKRRQLVHKAILTMIIQPRLALVLIIIIKIVVPNSIQYSKRTRFLKPFSTMADSSSGASTDVNVSNGIENAIMSGEKGSYIHGFFSLTFMSCLAVVGA